MKNILFLIILLSLPNFVQAQNDNYGVTLGHDLDSSIKSLQKSFLNLPSSQVTRDDLREFEKDLNGLRVMIGDSGLGKNEVKALAKPIERMEKALDHLRNSKNINNAHLNELRRWSRYLIQMPVTQASLAKGNVHKGWQALKDKEYKEAQVYLKGAIDHVLKIKQRVNPSLRKYLDQVHSEVTILYTAALREEILDKKSYTRLEKHIEDAFKVYHDNAFNLWSTLPQQDMYQ